MRTWMNEVAKMTTKESKPGDPGEGGRVFVGFYGGPLDGGVVDLFPDCAEGCAQVINDDLRGGRYIWDGHRFRWRL